MAYLDAVSVHARPTESHIVPFYPTTTLFPQGPDWTRRFQRNQHQNHLDDQFMYKDQGPPMYRLLGHHFNMYKVPPRTDFHAYSRSYHYEPRQFNSPNPLRGTYAFPSYPPPPQVAMYDGMKEIRQLTPQTKNLEMPGQTAKKSLKPYDKYRYLSGPPNETQLYGSPQGWQLPKI